MVMIITQTKTTSTTHSVKSSWIIISRVTILASSLMAKRELGRVTPWFDFPEDIKFYQGFSADKRSFS